MDGRGCGGKSAAAVAMTTTKTSRHASLPHTRLSETLNTPKIVYTTFYSPVTW